LHQTAGRNPAATGGGRLSAATPGSACCTVHGMPGAAPTWRHQRHRRALHRTTCPPPIQSAGTHRRPAPIAPTGNSSRGRLTTRRAPPRSRPRRRGTRPRRSVTRRVHRPRSRGARPPAGAPPHGRPTAERPDRMRQSPGTPAPSPAQRSHRSRWRHNDHGLRSDQNRDRPGPRADRPHNAAQTSPVQLLAGLTVEPRHDRAEHRQDPAIRIDDCPLHEQVRTDQSQKSRNTRSAGSVCSPCAEANRPRAPREPAPHRRLSRILVAVITAHWDRASNLGCFTLSAMPIRVGRRDRDALPAFGPLQASFAI
jgi:hypothetical protein